jgi:hypothetical protein
MDLIGKLRVVFPLDENFFLLNLRIPMKDSLLGGVIHHMDRFRMVFLSDFSETYLLKLVSFCPICSNYYLSSLRSTYLIPFCYFSTNSLIAS